MTLICTAIKKDSVFAREVSISFLFLWFSHEQSFHFVVWNINAIVFLPILFPRFFFVFVFFFFTFFCFVVWFVFISPIYAIISLSLQFFPLSPFMGTSFLFTSSSVSKVLWIVSYFLIFWSISLISYFLYILKWSWVFLRVTTQVFKPLLLYQFLFLIREIVNSVPCLR